MEQHQQQQQQRNNNKNNNHDDDNLEHFSKDKKINVSAPSIKVIVPVGEILIDDGVKIKSCEDIGARKRFFIYDMHKRFNHMVAHDITARLRLVGLHISTSSLIPDPQMKKTGDERAIELLRQCWINRPMTNEENERFQNVKLLCKGRCPELSLLCTDLERSANQCSFLHMTDSDYIAESFKVDETMAFLAERSRV